MLSSVDTTMVNPIAELYNADDVPAPDPTVAQLRGMPYPG